MLKIEKSVKVIIALITAIALGFSYITNEEKIFNGNAYFQPEERVVNDKARYGDLNNYSEVSAEYICNLTNLALPTELGVILNGYLLSDTTTNVSLAVPILFPAPFLEATDAASVEDYLKSNIALLNDNYGIITTSAAINSKDTLYRYYLPDQKSTTIFELPYGTPIVAPADMYIQNYNHPNMASYRDNIEGVSLGNYIEGIIICSTPVEGKQGWKLFKLTLGSLDRWWCCKDRPQATKDTLVGHSHNAKKTGVLTVSKGKVLGYTGLSGTSSNANYDKINRITQFDAGRSILIVRVQEMETTDGDMVAAIKDSNAQARGSWKPSSLYNLYKQNP